MKWNFLSSRSQTDYEPLLRTAPPRPTPPKTDPVSTDNSFKLLKLEKSDFEQVLLLMDPFTQLSFASLSKKARQQMRNAHEDKPKRKTYIELCYSDRTVEFVIHSEADNNVGYVLTIYSEINSQLEISSSNRKIGSGFAYFKPRAHREFFDIKLEKVFCSSQYYSDDTLVEVEQLLNRLIFIYHEPITSLRIDFGKFENPEINWILPRLVSTCFNNYYISLSCSNDELLRNILNSLKSAEYVHMKCQITQTFNYPVEKLNVKKRFRIQPVNYIKLEQLYHFTSNYVILSQTNFTNFEFQMMVRTLKLNLPMKWTQACISFSEYINIDRVIDKEFVMVDRSFKGNMINKADKNMHYKVVELNPCNGEVSTGFHWLRQDGSILTVCVQAQLIFVFIQKQDDQTLLTWL